MGVQRPRGSGGGLLQTFLNVADFHGYMDSAENQEAANHRLLLVMLAMLLALLGAAAMVVGITLLRR